MSRDLPISLDPSAVGLRVNARDACSCEDFCVGDHVLPLDAQNNPQTFCMDVVEFSGVTTVHSP